MKLPSPVWGRARRPCQTPHVPPAKPIVTVLPSTMTGTSRTPWLCFSMRCRSAALFFTLMYSNATPRFWQSSRAASV